MLRPLDVGQREQSEKCEPGCTEATLSRDIRRQPVLPRAPREVATPVQKKKSQKIWPGPSCQLPGCSKQQSAMRQPNMPPALGLTIMLPGALPNWSMHSSYSLQSGSNGRPRRVTTRAFIVCGSTRGSSVCKRLNCSSVVPCRARRVPRSEELRRLTAVCCTDCVLLRTCVAAMTQGPFTHLVRRVTQRITSPPPANTNFRSILDLQACQTWEWAVQWRPPDGLMICS